MQMKATYFIGYDTSFQPIYVTHYLYASNSNH